MKKLILLIAFISITNLNVAQNIKTKNIIEFSPSNATKVNGLSVKYWDVDSIPKKYHKKVNGIELGLNPLGVFFPFLVVIHSLNPFKIEPSIKYYQINKVVNGLQFSLGNLEETTINGIEINFSGGIHTVTNGLSISPSINKHYGVKGITIAPIGNFDSKFRGIQIGLINKSCNSKGIQIGLWNKNEKRSFPIINWNF